MGQFYEFFAGGGMARVGLGKGWQCLFANDFDPKKGTAYAANWGADELRIDDVAALTTADLLGRADLAWASFPCQDLSLAGNGAGINGKRSSAFWPFWNLVKALEKENRIPQLLVLENLLGLLSSHSSKDFATIGTALADAGYHFGAVIMDAVHFVPQSRPRLFIVGALDSIGIPAALVADGPDDEWHPSALVKAYSKLSKRSQDAWVWWCLPAPPARNSAFADLVENNPQGVTWHTDAETMRLLDMMSPINRAKVEAAKKAGRRMVGTIYKRTRADGPNGEKRQRAEIRFDDVAGCLRTPAGGSSRQTIMVVEGKSVRSRLLSPREAARLMGLPDTYILPKNYNEAYHLAGDGVVVPVVRFLAEHVLEPLLATTMTPKKTTNTAS